MQERISVLIPVYNVKPWLDACLVSVMHQTRPADEMILVDNGSTDGSGALCNAWALRYPCIRVIHRDNGGVSAARNTAMDAATGELIAPVDADDWLEPEYLETLLA